MKKILLPLLSLVLFCASCSNEKSSRETTTTDAVDASPAADKSETHLTESDIEQPSRKAAGQITAGEWNDASHWDFWRSLMKQDVYGGMQKTWSFNLKDRIVVNAQTSAGNRAIDVPVKLLSTDDEVLWEGRTDNKGTVSLFPLMKDGQQAQSLKIEAGNVTKNISGRQGEPIKITVPSQIFKPLLDVAFMVDATGSMDDEMDYLKAELTDVIHRVAQQNDHLAIRTGAVFYRDENDDYLTRKSAFTEDVAETVGFIRKQEAEGGGDFPEAVHTALDVALNDLDWSEHACARLLFLVLDAPPHDDPAIIRKVNRLVALAGAKGIRIIPVVSSGINKETEFLMRYMAIATGGTYVFLTDDSGIGNSHIQPTIGNYDVEYLNALLVRVIDGYVAVRNLQ